MRNERDKSRTPVLRNFDDHGDTNGCWDWLGKASTYGYGSVKKSIHGTAMAHRLFYEQYKGPIPPGMEIYHLCKNRRCVNPDHLEPVRKADNARRGKNAKLTMLQVWAIRQEHANGLRNHHTLAAKYGVGKTQIHRILSRRSWS